MGIHVIRGIPISKNNNKYLYIAKSGVTQGCGELYTIHYYKDSVVRQT